MINQHALAPTAPAGISPHPAVSIPAPSAAGPSIHWLTRCDGCKQAPIRGTRHQCTACPDFDLCPRCFQSAVAHAHPRAQFRSILSPDYDIAYAEQTWLNQLEQDTGASTRALEARFTPRGGVALSHSEIASARTFLEQEIASRRSKFDGVARELAAHNRPALSNALQRDIADTQSAMRIYNEMAQVIERTYFCLRVICATLADKTTWDPVINMLFLCTALQELHLTTDCASYCAPIHASLQRRVKVWSGCSNNDFTGSCK